MSTSRGPGRPLLPGTRAGTALTLAGVHAGLWLKAPGMAMIITMLEAALAVAVVATALYASKTISDRAFRLLPWTTRAPSRSRPRRKPPSRAEAGTGGVETAPGER